MLLIVYFAIIHKFFTLVTNKVMSILDVIPSTKCHYTLQQNLHFCAVRYRSTDATAQAPSATAVTI